MRCRSCCSSPWPCLRRSRCCRCRSSCGTAWARRGGRRAAGWSTINLIVIGISTALFLLSAAVTSVWVPRAFPYTALGLAAGCLLGLFGLARTRWEATSSALYFTPSRALTLAVTLLVTARVLFGFWRSWRAWGAGVHYSSWIAASDVAGSMAAGAHRARVLPCLLARGSPALEAVPQVLNSPVYLAPRFRCVPGASERQPPLHLEPARRVPLLRDGAEVRARRVRARLIPLHVVERVDRARTAPAAVSPAPAGTCAAVLRSS